MVDEAVLKEGIGNCLEMVNEDSVSTSEAGKGKTGFNKGLRMVFEAILLTSEAEKCKKGVNRA